MEIEQIEDERVTRRTACNRDGGCGVDGGAGVGNVDGDGGVLHVERRAIRPDLLCGRSIGEPARDREDQGREHAAPAGAHAFTWLRPPALARYSASSARAMRSSVEPTPDD